MMKILKSSSQDLLRLYFVLNFFAPARMVQYCMGFHHLHCSKISCTDAAAYVDSLSITRFYNPHTLSVTQRPLPGAASKATNSLEYEVHTGSPTAGYCTQLRTLQFASA